MNEPDFGFVVPHWAYWGWLAVMPLVMLWFSRRDGVMRATSASPVSLPVTRWIDRLSRFSGLFVAFWTVNAVLAYTYEVVMRYFFNMPTIWVHEACFLLFGMQYLLAGAYTLLEDGHVRVDVVYSKLPRRGQVALDILTSVFFFMFALALLGTAWRFFISAYQIDERTIETWQIQYWPVKGMMALGALLLLLAGISKLIKDIVLFYRLGQPGDHRVELQPPSSIAHLEGGH